MARLLIQPELSTGSPATGSSALLTPTAVLRSKVEAYYSFMDASLNTGFDLFIAGIITKDSLHSAFSVNLDQYDGLRIYLIVDSSPAGSAASPADFRMLAVPVKRNADDQYLDQLSDDDFVVQFSDCPTKICTKTFKNDSNTHLLPPGYPVP